MITTVVVLVVSFILTLIIGKFLLAGLRKLRAGQEIRKDGPKWHASKAGTPTMGGIMFILGVGISVVAVGWRFMLNGVYLHIYLYLFSLSFGLIGFIDDFTKVVHHQNEGLTARQKFALQLAMAVLFLSLMRYEGFLNNELYIPVANITVTIPWLLYLFFSVFAIVGCVNSVNLTDGVDGLATSVTFIVMVFFCLLGIFKANLNSLFPAALAGGLAAFFVYNHHPAKIFMGDTGSLFLGGAVAALAFAVNIPLILIPVGIIYIAETMSDIIQVSYFKATHGKRVFKMAPLHHHLELSGWSEEKLVTVFSCITIIGCIFAWFAVQGKYSG